MNPALRKRLILAGTGGTLAIASALGSYFEGTVYTAYRDPVGIWTVCRGITGPDVIQGKRYTEAECHALELKHLAIAEMGVKRQLRFYGEYSKWRQAALIDFTFNAGEANLRTSTMRKLFNSGDAVGGCNELSRWIKGRVNGILTVLRGLVTRRDVELELCLLDGDLK